MKIGFLLPSLFASQTLYPKRIFAPKELAQNLVNRLVKKGHEVVVFSTPDFETHAKLVPGNMGYMQNKIIYHKLRNDPSEDRRVRTDEVIKRNFEMSVTSQAFTYAREHGLDVIHSYHDFVFTPHYFEQATGVPVVYTLHDPLPPENTFEYAEFTTFAAHRYISISDSQRRSSLKLNFAATVYHGIEETQFPFEKQASDYLLFMGRLVPEKGLHSAIEVALKVNMQLEIGTQFPDHEHESPYFKTKIKPYLENPFIGEPGMVDGANKILLYKKAKALLFPIEWEEPFGMVMIEAMACGVPVIAYNRGSVAEIVKDGVSGFVIDQDDTNRPGKGGWKIKKQGVAGLVEAVERLGEIDRGACRTYIENHFTVEKMTADHEKVYQKIVEGYKMSQKEIVYEGSSHRV